MHKLFGMTLFAGLTLATFAVWAQPPGGGRRGESAGTAESFIARLFAFDANQDGKLSKEEMTDKRLLPLFERADADHDGVVTKDELQALYSKESATAQAAGGPDGPGGPGRGFGGPGGPGGFGGGPGRGEPPKPGQILPPFVQEQLNLSNKQKEELAALQKEVDAKLAKILTKEQRQQLEEIGQRGPGGPDGPPPGGRGGRGGPGGFGPPGGGPGGGGPPRGR
jgi:hypothetical protein